jgi:hypothetical protein
MQAVIFAAAIINLMIHYHVINSANELGEVTCNMSSISL